MGYQGEGEEEDGRQAAWLVGRKADLSGQAEQELGKTLGGKDGREVSGKIGGWEVGGIQDVDRYVDPVREEREKNDAGEDKDVGKNVDTCTQTVEAFGHEIDGVEFQQEVGECFEGWECDENVGSMKAG